MLACLLCVGACVFVTPRTHARARAHTHIHPHSDTQVYSYLLGQGADQAPNVYHYNALITACQRTQQWSTALHLLSEMRAQGLPADTITYSSVISACGRGRRWDMALEVLALMQQQGVDVNIITVNAVVSSCEKAG